VHNDIPLICSAEMEYGTFEFSNAILDGRKNDALSILSVMKFKQIEPLMIMGELSGIFSDLLKIKIMLLAGKNNQQIATETGINIHKVGIYVNSARRMELERLQRTVSLAREADLAMKYRFDSGYLHLEKLICSI
jgi:DNA polymerase III delta subunit